MYLFGICRKLFKQWEYQTTLHASWEICMQVKKQQLELDIEQQSGSKSGKKYVKAVYGIKIAGRNINNLRYADDTTFMAENEEELKSLLMKMKQESEKFGLKLNIQKTKIMASGAITSWEIDGETMETVADFIYWAPKSLQMVTAAMKWKDTWSLEEKLWLS